VSAATKAEAEKQAKRFLKVLSDLVEMQAKARREISRLEKEPSLSERAAFDLRILRLGVALGDKLLEAERAIKVKVGPKRSLPLRQFAAELERKRSRKPAP